MIYDYLVVGEDWVDLGRAMTRIRSTLNATAVIADGGGGLNGALFRAGLIDEVHLITFPALVGGLGTPSFLDAPPLPPGYFTDGAAAPQPCPGCHGKRVGQIRGSTTDTLTADQRPDRASGAVLNAETPVNR